MSTLIAIGNSQGIRIPKPIIKQARLENMELELVVVENGLLVTPIHKPNRESWAEDIGQVMSKQRDQTDEALQYDMLDDSDLEDYIW